MTPSLTSDTYTTKLTTSSMGSSMRGRWGEARVSKDSVGLGYLWWTCGRVIKVSLPHPPSSSALHQSLFKSSHHTPPLQSSLLTFTDAHQGITIHAELPGIKKEDIHLDMSEGVLTLSGEKKDMKKEDDEHYHRYHSLLSL